MVVRVAAHSRSLTSRRTADTMATGCFGRYSDRTTSRRRHGASARRMERSSTSNRTSSVSCFCPRFCRRGASCDARPSRVVSLQQTLYRAAAVLPPRRDRMDNRIAFGAAQTGSSSRSRSTPHRRIGTAAMRASPAPVAITDPDAGAPCLWSARERERPKGRASRSRSLDDVESGVAHQV